MTNLKLTNYRGRKTYVLENEFLQVKVIPSLGGKTVSIYHKEREFELLYDRGQNPLIKSKPGDSFESGEASGFDDAFPCIDKEQVNYNQQLLYYPDHGEIWTASMKYQKGLAADTLKLKYNGKLFPYSYEKDIALEGDIVKYHYHITNTGEIDFPCIWAMHCLVRYEEDMKFLFPNDTNEFENVLSGKELGAEGTYYPFEYQGYPFDKVPDKNSHTMLKYYIKNQIHDGVCGYYYPSHRVQCLIQYDTQSLPYLGVWVNAGGYRGEFNCALEPANGYYDSISKALNRKKCPILKSGESLDFSITIKLHSIKR